ncbi:MAG: hypothetical protein NTY98_16770 [Verrucomicrobia bacterium]|nr:hypothetical protein [Verrucomicrobiota bacterium]
MMKTREERMDEWMREQFQKTGHAAENYSVFAELFLAVFKSILGGEKIDALECPDQPLDAESPELGTAREVIEERIPVLFQHYLKCLDDGYSPGVARIFALKVEENCDDVERASRDTFDAICIGWDCNMSNPAYAEALAVCLHQGRSVLFAEKCAEYLLDCDLSFSRAQKQAGQYEKIFGACLAKGYPEVRAKAFAQYVTTVTDNRAYAEPFAREYEEQVSAGKPHHEAWYYADKFAEHFQQCCGDDWEESEADGDNDWARIHTEGHVRAGLKGFDCTDYAKRFARHYENTPEQPDQPLAERLAEIEARTDFEMKVLALCLAHRNDKGCDPGTVYLNLETRRTATEAGGWDKLSVLGVSIAVTITTRGPQIFTEDKIPELAGALSRAERIVGYNLRHFDLKVLAGYAEFSTGKARVVDLLDEVERAAGHRVSLQALASATLGIRFSCDSLDMVKLWKEGKVLDVIEGCSNQVFAIKALHEHARAHGELFYFLHENEQRERIAINKDVMR